MGILWLGETAGLLAAIIPGGLGMFSGTTWGVLGLVGIILLLAVIFTLKSGMATG